MNSESKCLVMGATHQAVGDTANQHWWPNQLNLRILRQNHPQADPNGGEFNYAEEFKSLDFETLEKDVDALMTQSQDWWPADYGPLRTALRPDDVARSRYVPHRRRPRRRQQRRPALCPPR